MTKKINQFSPIRTGSTLIYNYLKFLLKDYHIVKQHNINKNEIDIITVITMRHPYNSILSTILVNENFGQDFVYDLNSEKLRKKLNWNDKINLEDGIDYTINWINQNWSYIKKDSTEYKHIT